MNLRPVACLLVALLGACPAKGQFPSDDAPDIIGEGYQAIYFKLWNQLSPRQQELLRTYFDHNSGNAKASSGLATVVSLIDQNRLAGEWSKLVGDHNDWAADFLAVTQALSRTTIDLGSGEKINALDAVKGIDSLHGDRLYTVVDPAVFQQWRDAGGGFSIATADDETETGRVHFDRGDLGGSLHRGYDLQGYTSVAHVPRIQWNYRVAGSLADTDLDAFAPWKEGMMPNPRHRTFANSDPRQWLPSYIRKYGDPGFTVRKAENVTLTEAREPPAPAGSQISPEVERQALELAGRFTSEIEQKKDFGATVDHLFASDFMDRYLRDADNYPLTGLAREVAAKVDGDQLRRYYVDLNNFYNLSAVSPGTSNLFDSLQKDLPAGLSDVLAGSQLQGPGGSAIGSQAEFQAALAMLEKAVSALQASVSPDVAAQISEYLKQSPRQETAQDNSATVLKSSNDSLLKPWAVTCDRQCFGFPAGTELIAINVPYHQLLLARIDGQLKIISAIPLSTPTESAPTSTPPVHAP